MQNTHPAFTETGCYLDNHRGHYISRDAIEFAVAHGFILDPCAAYVVARYEDDGHAEDYPSEIIFEICDEAVDWLNSSPTEREINGQNCPPARPNGTYWEFNDGDFGLYLPECEGHPSTNGPIGNVEFCDGSCHAA